MWMASAVTAACRKAAHLSEDPRAAAFVSRFSFRISLAADPMRGCTGTRHAGSRALTTLAAVTGARPQAMPTTVALHPSSLRFFRPAPLSSPLPSSLHPSRPRRPSLRASARRGPVLYATPFLEQLIRASVLPRRRRLLRRHPSLSTLPLHFASLPPALCNLAPSFPPPSFTARLRWPKHTVRRSMERSNPSDRVDSQWFTPIPLHPSLCQDAWESTRLPEVWEKSMQAAQKEKEKKMNELAAMLRSEQVTGEGAGMASAQYALEAALVAVRRQHSPLLTAADYGLLMTAAVRAAKWPWVVELGDELCLRFPESALTPLHFNLILAALAHDTAAPIDPLLVVLRACRKKALQHLISHDSLYLVAQWLSRSFVNVYQQGRAVAQEQCVAATLPAYYQRLASLIAACRHWPIGVVVPSSAAYGVVIDALVDSGNLRDAAVWLMHSHRVHGTPLDTHHLARVHRIMQCADRVLQPQQSTPQPDAAFLALVDGPLAWHASSPLCMSASDPPTCPAASHLTEAQLRMFTAWLLQTTVDTRLLPVTWDPLQPAPCQLTVDLSSTSATGPPASAVSSAYLAPLPSTSPTYLAAVQDLLTRILPAHISGQHRDGIGLDLARSSPVWHDLSLSIHTPPGTHAHVHAHFEAWLDQLHAARARACMSQPAPRSRTHTG